MNILPAPVEIYLLLVFLHEGGLEESLSKHWNIYYIFIVQRDLSLYSDNMLGIIITKVFLR